jgi:hypothetical protein
MHPLRFILWFSLVLLIGSCKPALQSTTTGKQDAKAYFEDLSALRPPLNGTANGQEGKKNNTPTRNPHQYVEPVYTVNQQVDAVLDSIDRFHLGRGYIEGYTIQIYAGIKRDEALQVKKNMLQYLPQFETEIQYNQPTFRVKTGTYFTLLEAQKDFQLIRQYFPSAILVPDKITIAR